MTINTKINRLLKKVNAFYSKALQAFEMLKTAQSGFYMPDDDESEISDDGSILSRAEQFDIKNEELFNQFELFVSAYRDLINSLSINANNLNHETFEDAGQLIDTLNKRYERIINNPYLNMSKDYEEDFNPGDLTKFIQDAVADAEKQLKTAAGEDVDIDEMRAAQYAQQFNDNRNIDKGDQNITWTGNKVQQNLLARKIWYEKLMFVKKFGKGHPDYARYEHYVNARRERFNNFLDNLRQNDPAGWRAFQDKMNERVRIHYHRYIDKHHAKNKNKAVQLREVKQSATLEGYVTHLKQKLATAKSEIAKIVKKRAADDPYFTKYKRAVQLAKEKFDKEKSPANKKEHDDAIKNELTALQNYLDNHPMVVKVVADFKLLYAYRDATRTVIDAGWLSQPEIPNEVKPHLYQLIIDGEELIERFGSIYKKPCMPVKDIVNYVKTALGVDNE